jgi:hypothetical protein
MTVRLVQFLFAFAATVIGYSANGQAHNTEPPYVPVTLCELSFHRERPNPKHVSIEAEYVSGIPHGLVLIDRRCEGKGLGIDFADTGLDPSVAFIKRHLFEIHRANGTFRGTLKRDRVTGRLYLWLESVVDFRSDDIQDEDKPIHLPDPPPPTWPPTW